MALEDGWYAAKGPKVLPLPTEGNAADTAAFERALALSDGADTRVAWIMQPQHRDAINQMMANPNDPQTAMLAGMLQPLQQLDTAGLGMWLGDQPRIKLSMQFSDAVAATQFKMQLDQMVQMVGMMAQMAAMQQAQDPNAAEMPDPQKMQAALSLLMLDQNETTLTKTIDTASLKQLGDAGISWLDFNQTAPPAGPAGPAEPPFH